MSDHAAKERVGPALREVEASTSAFSLGDVQSLAEPRTLASAGRPAAGPAMPKEGIVTLSPPGKKEAIDLIKLYHAVEQTLPTQGHSIIQMVSATSDEGHAETASSLAWVASSMLGKRVLFIDATAGQSKWFVIPSAMRASKTLNDAALGAVPKEEVIGHTLGQSLFLTRLQRESASGATELATSHLQGLFDELRPMFDLIIIAPTPALDEPLSGILSSFVDGSVLVARAGKSSGRKLEECLDVLETRSAPVVGVVMRRRKSRLPRWLQRWI